MLYKYLKFVLFAGSIFLMAAVYQSIYQFRPDYFRIQGSAGYNLLPIDIAEAVINFPTQSTEPLPTLKRLTREVEAAHIRSIYSDVQKKSEALSLKEHQLDDLNKREESDYTAFQELQQKHADDFVSQRKKPFEDKLNILNLELKSILESEGVDDKEKLSNQKKIQYADVNAEILQTKVHQLQVEIAAGDYVLKHLIEFQQTPEQQAYIVRSRNLARLEKEVGEAKQEIWAKRAEFLEALSQYRTKSLEALTYWDFVYFSVGATTTAAFGDITPNHKWVRMLVCAQVLASIIFVGVLINNLPQNQKSKRDGLHRSSAYKRLCDEIAPESGIDPTRATHPATTRPKLIDAAQARIV
jgi:hypothetical protein